MLRSRPECPTTRYYLALAAICALSLIWCIGSGELSVVKRDVTRVVRTAATGIVQDLRTEVLQPPTWPVPIGGGLSLSDWLLSHLDNSRVNNISTLLPITRFHVFNRQGATISSSGPGSTKHNSIWLIFGGLISLILLVLGLLITLVKYLARTASADAAHEREFQENDPGGLEFLKLVIDSIPGELMVLSPEREIILANRLVREKYSLGPEPALRFCHQVSHRSDKPCSSHDDPCPLLQVLDSGQTATVRHRHFNSDGSLSFVEVTASPVFDDKGNIIQIIENSRDITGRVDSEQKIIRANTELRLANEKLKAAEAGALALAEAAHRASDAKSTFLANMSHEIRTPMTAILGYAELLADESVPGSDGDEYLGVIRRSGEHLLAVINDILDMAKIEAGKMTVELCPVRPRELLGELIGLMENRAAAKGLDLAADCSPDVPAVVLTDPTRLKQALVNLVGNAIKFTQEGRIRVSISPETDSAFDHPRLVFQVSDSGVGIDEETCGRLFQPFQQGNSSTTRLYGGTGLGLVITRSIAELLGGDVSVTSRKGQGSTFTLVIDPGEMSEAPVADHSGKAEAVGPEQSPRRNKAIDLTGINVLYAEDGRDNQVLVQRILEKAGACVDLAANGNVAVEKCGEGTYDLVLMDQQMPEMDGLEATRVICAQGYQGPIVALSANAMEIDRHLSFQAGCVDHLNKPINRRQLLETVLRYSHSG